MSRTQDVPRTPVTGNRGSEGSSPNEQTAPAPISEPVPAAATQAPTPAPTIAPTPARAPTPTPTPSNVVNVPSWIELDRVHGRLGRTDQVPGGRAGRLDDRLQGRGDVPHGPRARDSQQRDLVLDGNGATLRSNRNTARIESDSLIALWGGNDGIVIHDFHFDGDSPTPGVYSGATEGVARCSCRATTSRSTT